MKKLYLTLIFLIFIILIFNKQIIKHVFLYGFAKWIDRQITVDRLDIYYDQALIVVHGLKVKNSKKFYYDNLLKVEKITLNIDKKSFFSNLIIIENLIIENPEFFLEIIKKTSTVYNDNIGLASKITENKPDKIWPKKIMDINFLVLELKITEGKSFIRKSDLLNIFESNMSQMTFYKVGNEKKYQHYKDVFKTILFSIIGRISNNELQELLRKIYKIE